MTNEEAVIDRIDLKILNVLQIDGRISNLKLAESVALSPTAVLRDLQRQWEQRAIKSEEFRSVFMHEHGSEQAPLPPGYYVPGDRV